MFMFSQPGAATVLPLLFFSELRCTFGTGSTMVAVKYFALIITVSAVVSFVGTTPSSRCMKTLITNIKRCKKIETTSNVTSEVCRNLVEKLSCVEKAREAADECPPKVLDTIDSKIEVIRQNSAEKCKNTTSFEQLTANQNNKESSSSTSLHHHILLVFISSVNLHLMNASL